MGKRIAAIAGALTEELGRRLGRFLTRPSHAHSTAAPTDPTRLMGCLQAGDVLLVEGTTRIAMAIRYLTQSTWSHAALYVGNALRQPGPSGKAGCFIEADLANGVRAVDVSEFKGLHCRVCRLVGLNSDEIERVVGFAVDQIGRRYDLKNIVDLARYLLPEPPVPRRWRRRMLALGSGDPTKAICSTLIAEAFQVVRYPVLPIVESVPLNDPHCPGCVAEILHARHHSLYTPRDFDVSPYFAIVKPTLAAGFDPHVLVLNDGPRAIAPLSEESPTGTIVARISH